MKFDQTEGTSPEGQCSVYALVIYIPEPLGEFLDALRRELVPEYNPHAHVSVLPPRRLAVGTAADASRQAREVAEKCPGFDVELTEIGIFPGTDVIYIEVGKGTTDLRGMHDALNTGALEFPEPYVYHPHITLAQEIPADRVQELKDTAARRWREYKGTRTFRADRAVFVENVQDNCWRDIEYYSIGRALAGV